MTSHPPADERCSIVLEDFPPGWANAIMSDPSPDAMQRGIEELADLLTGLVEQPERVTLVVSVDMAQAVMRRDQSVHYTLERGSGMAGARTMARDDGWVDVVINGNALGLVDPDGDVVVTSAGLPRLNADAFPYVRHSVVHEAQHVVMEQFGSGFDAYDRDRIVGSARYEIFACATKFCDEHRAEAAATPHLQLERETVKDVLDVLSALGSQLAAAIEAYRQSSDIYALKDGVLGACVHYWTALAYWTAHHRVEDVVGEIQPDVAALEVWQRYIGPTWDSLRSALPALPVYDLHTDVDVLHAAASVIANVLDESLQYIGFRYFDQGGEDWWFNADRLDYPSE